MQEPMLKVAPTQCATLESLHLCTSMLWIYANDEWIAAVGCALHGWPFCGQTGLMHVRLLLTQHFLALAASLIGQCSTFHQTGRSNASIRTNLRRVFASLGPNNQDVDFSSARSTASCENSRPKSLVWVFYWSADTISICTPDQRRRQTQDLQNSCFT